jgi:hypothetical protein
LAFFFFLAFASSLLSIRRLHGFPAMRTREGKKKTKGKKCDDDDDDSDVKLTSAGL